MKIYKALATAAVVVGMALGSASCRSKPTGGQVLGLAAPPEGYAPVTVQELVEGNRWQDQRVLFEGTISAVGCVGCGGVIIADRTWRVSTEPEDPSQFKIPVRPGARLRVWGVLRVADNGFREVKAHRVEFLGAAAGKRPGAAS